jgi:hypothetical protein
MTSPRFELLFQLSADERTPSVYPSIYEIVIVQTYYLGSAHHSVSVCVLKLGDVHPWLGSRRFH